MNFMYDDGGRAAAGFKGTTGDCVCRAISIAAELPYKEVYTMINDFGKQEGARKKCSGRSGARTGVYKDTTRKIMAHLDWKWTPTMQVGQGCKVHLRPEELPKGRIIVSLSNHCAAVIGFSTTPTTAAVTEQGVSMDTTQRGRQHEILQHTPPGHAGQLPEAGGQQSLGGRQLRQLYAAMKKKYFTEGSHDET